MDMKTLEYLESRSKAGRELACKIARLRDSLEKISNDDFLPLVQIQTPNFACEWLIHSLTQCGDRFGEAIRPALIAELKKLIADLEEELAQL